jgi:hypothetical protein
MTSFRNIHIRKDSPPKNTCSFWHLRFSATTSLSNHLFIHRTRALGFIPVAKYGPLYVIRTIPPESEFDSRRMAGIICTAESASFVPCVMEGRRHYICSPHSWGWDKFRRQCLSTFGRLFVLIIYFNGDASLEYERVHGMCDIFLINLMHYNPV